MRVVLPGGTGQVGTILARAFVAQGAEVVAFSRQPEKAQLPPGARVLPWDGATLGPWAEALEGADAVINLAGRSVNCRYNARNRCEILESRVRSTRAVGQAIAACAAPPRLWLQASTATIYSHRYDAPNDETTGVLGGSEPDAPATWRFSIDVARAWEQTARESAPPGVRLVLLRSAMVMSPDRGGVFDTLLGLVRRGLGGRMGDGRQYVSWIHHEDFVAAVRFLMEREDIDGPVNVASPHPIPNDDVMRALRQAWGARVGLPATTWMLEIGAVFLRTETELILKSRRVVPSRLLEAGFAFRFPRWPEAARDLCEAVKQSRAAQRRATAAAAEGG